MKKHLSSLLLLVGATILVVPQLRAQSFTTDGVTYTVLQKPGRMVSAKAAAKSITGQLALPDSVADSGVYYKVNEIAESGFEGCVSLTGVIFPKSMGVVGDKAFRESGIKSLSGLPDTCRIGEYAFQNCDSLRSVVLPRRLTVLPRSVFDGCRILSSVSLGGWLTEIGLNAFGGCAVVKMIIPGSVKTLGAYAMSDYTAMTYLELGSGLRTVGTRCISSEANTLRTIKCRAQTPPVLASGAISPNVLRNTRLEVPYGCLEAYKNADGWKEFDSITEELPFNIRVVSAADKTCSVSKLSTGISGFITIPTTVEIQGVPGYTVVEITANGFAGCGKITGISIPRSVKKVGNYAFERCGITEVTLPDDVTWGSYVFSECKSMVKASLPKNMAEIPQSMFNGCSALTEIIWPMELKGTAMNALRETGFTKLRFPETVTYLKSYTLYNCKALRYLELPAVLDTLGTCAVNINDSVLRTIRVLNPVPPRTGTSVFRDVTMRTARLVVPRGSLAAYKSKAPWNQFLNIEEESQLLFSPLKGDSASVKAAGTDLAGMLVIPDTCEIEGDTYIVSEIAPYGFQNCQKLTGLQFGANVRKIGRLAFDVTNITAIEVPDGVIVEQEAFQRNISLERVKLPSDMKEIPYSLFFNCPKLSEIVWPENVESTSQSSFVRTGFTKMVIPSSMKYIAPYTFYNCENLSSVDIPEGVDSVGICTFFTWYGNGLRTIIVRKTTPLVYDPRDSFTEWTYQNATLYVPEESIEKYKATAPWKNFRHITKIIAGGVDTLDMDTDTPAVYYDLNGRRMTSAIIPPGIYIEVRGSKVRKVIVK